MRYLFIFLFLLSSVMMKAQYGMLFTPDNGLSSSFVTDIMQDRAGFIWIATRNGMNIYDGYRFKVIKADMPEYETLASSYVNTMTQAKDGTVYLGTNRNIIRCHDFTFERVGLQDYKGHAVTTYVTSIMQRRNGSILAGTSGYGIMAMQRDGTFRSLPESMRTMQYVRKLVEDRKGSLWVITEGNGVYQQTSGGRWVKKPIPGNSTVVDIVETHHCVFLATAHDGIYCINGRSLSPVPGTRGLPISTVFVTRAGELLIGCDGRGVWQYDPQRGVLSPKVFYSYNIDFSKSKVSRFIEDRQGNIWIGLMQKGVFLDTRVQTPFGYIGYRLGTRNVIGSNCVTACMIDSRGHFWIGTDKDGIYHLDNRQQLVSHLTGVPSTTISLRQDSHGRIWVGSFGDGCGWIDPLTGSYHAVDLHLGKGVSVFDMAEDYRGNIWLATMGQGLVCRSSDGKTKVYRKARGADVDHKMNSLPNDYLSRLTTSRDKKKIYIASSVGLCCLNLTTMSWTDVLGANIADYGTFPHSIFADSKGRVWLGTEKGAWCYIGGRLRKKYTRRDGMPDNAISSICEDARGDIWFGTNHGLACLTPSTGAIHNYFSDDGLQSNEFSDGAISPSRDGTMILAGGTGGITWFNPTKLRENRWRATVKVIGLTIGNKDLPASDRFALSHEDNTFSLRLSTLTYGNSGNVRYLYSINEERWTMLPAGTNEIPFSHVAPGTYRIRVKAVNSSQETPVKEVTVVVNPAWYASMPARVIYVLVLIGLVWVYIRHMKRKEEEKLILQKHIHAEEMSEAKIKFFINISHDIRTPMTLILTPLLSLIKEDKDVHRQGIYQLMKRNAERVLHLINQMMDLRKIDQGKMAMRMRQTDYVETVEDACRMFVQQAKAKNIRFSFVHHDASLPIWIDPENFDKVIVNVLSNAFKFTPSGGTISVTLDHDDASAYLKIKDSGCGIPQDKLENIFQRFYQVSSQDQTVGTGIGLDLARTIVELHYGSIEARNNTDGPGVEFEISIPLGNAHLKPDEMVVREKEDDNADEHQTAEELDRELLETDTSEEQKTDAEIGGEKQQKPLVVIVEDDEEILHYLSHELSDAYNIKMCHDGKEGLRCILSSLPDIVISDVMMPEMDGNALCARVKQNINTSSIPVILLTAKSLEEDRLEGLETGADAYITKPFNMDILRRTVINLLDSRRLLKLKYSGQAEQAGKVDDVEMQSPDAKLLDRIMAVVNKHLSDSDITVDMIAEEVGISRIHLHRKMKELTGQSPHVFIRNIRLKQAARLLKDPHQSISEVTFACGFSSASSFSTIFKAAYGVSPRQYQMIHSNDPKDRNH